MPYWIERLGHDTKPTLNNLDILQRQLVDSSYSYKLQAVHSKSVLDAARIGLCDGRVSVRPSVCLSRQLWPGQPRSAKAAAHQRRLVDPQPVISGSGAGSRRRSLAAGARDRAAASVME